MKKKNQADAVIHMTVKDDSDFLSVYSVTDTPVISSEVAQFLEHSIQDLIRPEHLTLIIKSNCIDDTEKELYRKGYGSWRAYGRSKMEMLLFAYEMQRCLTAAGKSTIALAAHPRGHRSIGQGRRVFRAFKGPDAGCGFIQ